MTLYARSDLVLVTVSAEAHEGCGQTHTRPVEHGNPAKIWALSCPQCENHLRHDPLWASTPSKIPETHDEAANREERERHHQREQQDITANSLAILASLAGRDQAQQVPCGNGHLNPAVAKFCVECGAPVGRAAVLVCADGHESPGGARFCVECGLPVGVLEGPPRAVSEAAAEAALAETAPEPPAAAPKVLPPAAPMNPGSGTSPVFMPPKRVALPSNTKMRGMKREALLEWAADAGVDATGTREQVLNRLIAYNNA